MAAGSHLRWPSVVLLVLCLLIGIGSSSCKNKEVTESGVLTETQGEEFQATKSPDELAMGYCVYTQGPIPHWLLAEEFANDLVRRDRRLALEVAAETRAMLRPLERARQTAVYRFLRTHTTCTVQATRDFGDVRIFALAQAIPLIREPQGLDERIQGSEARWLAGFESAYDGGTQNEQFALRVVREEEEWRVDAQLWSHFGETKERMKGLDSLDASIRAHSWREARTLYDEYCGAEQGELCVQAGAALTGAEAREPALSTLLKQVEVIGAQVVARMSGNTSLNILRVTLANRGTRAFSELWVSAREGGSVERCLLKAGGTAVELRGGAEVTGECRLTAAMSTPKVELIDLVEH